MTPDYKRLPSLHRNTHKYLYLNGNVIIEWKTIFHCANFKDK